MILVSILVVVIFVEGLNHIWYNYPLFSKLMEWADSKSESVPPFKLIYYPLIGCTYCMCILWGLVLYHDIIIAVSSLGLKVIYNEAIQKEG